MDRAYAAAYTLFMLGIPVEELFSAYGTIFVEHGEEENVELGTNLINKTNAFNVDMDLIRPEQQAWVERVRAIVAYLELLPEQWVSRADKLICEIGKELLRREDRRRRTASATAAAGRIQAPRT